MAGTMAGGAALPARAQFNILLAMIALTALMVATTSVTQDGPRIAEEGVEEASVVEPTPAMERDVVLEGVDESAPASGWTVRNKNYKQRLVEPLEDAVLLEEAPKQGDLDSLSAALTATQAGLKAEAAERGGSDVSEDAEAETSDAEASDTSSDGDSSDAMDDAKVQEALKAAANAKIQALAAQQKALAAGAAAKDAAAQAAQAPMTQAGQEVVKRAQDKVHEAKLDVDTAKAAMVNLKSLKAKASKAILDAAGGGAAGEAYAGQGGYFGAALRTAYNNGVLSEKLKNQEFKTSELEKIKSTSYDEGEAAGEKVGFIKGEKVGQKEELPDAVMQAEHILSDKNKAEAADETASEAVNEEDAVAKQAEAEASKVRESVEHDAVASDDAVTSAADDVAKSNATDTASDLFGEPIEQLADDVVSAERSSY